MIPIRQAVVTDGNILYNDIEANALDWINSLIFAGELPWGTVDGRSIKSLTGADLVGVKQFHTFAGIGGWAHALQLAGWPEDEEVWTGSCPCQPFSSAGKQGGEDDPRHLWPDFFRLISERRPRTVFGEQVGGRAGYQWITGVYADLESIGYRVPKAPDGSYLAFDIPAAGVGAPHIRQRLYWVADLHHDGRPTEHGETRGPRGEVRLRDGALAGDGGAVERVDDLRRERDERRRDLGDLPGTPGVDEGEARQRQRDGHADCAPGSTCGLSDAERAERRAATGGRHEPDGDDCGRQEAAGGHGTDCNVDGLEKSDSRGRGRGDVRHSPSDSGRPLSEVEAERRLSVGGLGDGEGDGRRQVGEEPRGRGEGTGDATLDRLAHDGGALERLADDDDAGLQDGRARQAQPHGCPESFWADFRIVPCTDGKARRTGPDVFPLAHGLPKVVGDGGAELRRLARRASRARIGMLKGSGNAIVPELAAVFIRAYLDARGNRP